ncbi:MAG: acetylxylan esterase [Candidatus Omnitrophica bacterium]|nr:acetylxylan esterase [Candidatus Omnitrophota bacterium]
MAWQADPELVKRLTQEHKKYGAIYDEKLVPKYKLPDALTCLDGTKVVDKETWIRKRRPEILELFRTHMYGRKPAETLGCFRYEISDIEKNALEGIAIRKQVRIFFTEKQAPFMDLLVYLPKDADKPVPVFLLLHFYGNHTITDEKAIPIKKEWDRGKGVQYLPGEETRASHSKTIPVKKILSRGYGVATAYYCDIVPDIGIKCFNYGIFKAFDHIFGEHKPSDAWGAISAWAFGLTRIMDYFETDENIDSKKVAVLGHSRLGKTALWAGAQDDRFAIVISNNSGCGGAALSRRKFGETVKIINELAPHWFCENFKKYNDKEDKLAFDQHMLISLIAPRPVYVASADQDLWADPMGEFLSAKNAEVVYNLFGLDGLPADEIPDLNSPVMGTIGYHIREGDHALTEYDWDCYINFCDKHFRKKG